MRKSIKEKVKQRYGKIALIGTTESCCVPSISCCDPASPMESAKIVGYDTQELDAIPQSSILDLDVAHRLALPILSRVKQWLI